MIPRERVIIATGLPLLTAIREADLVKDSNVLAEPAKRNTLGCLAWVAANLLARHPGEEAEVGMAVLTADHKIGEPDLFRDTVRIALETAYKTGGLVTIGIKPTRPETGYGYVELADAIRHEKPEVNRVGCFREKPSYEIAKQYVEAGNYRWNSGMFFWSLRGFMGEMSHANPEVFAGILEMSQKIAEGDMDGAAQVFETLPNESIDYALLEKAHQVYTVSGEFPWDDVGAWDALERSMPGDSSANVVQGPALMVDTSGAIVYNDTNTVLVTAVGMKDIIIAVTDGAVMVCPKSEAQRVKEILKELPPDSDLR